MSHCELDTTLTQKVDLCDKLKVLSSVIGLNKMIYDVVMIIQIAGCLISKVFLQPVIKKCQNCGVISIMSKPQRSKLPGP